MRTERQVYPRIGARDTLDGVQRQSVIGVHAHKEIVVSIKNRAGVVPQLRLKW